jgi:hypothetical protein
MNKKKVKKKKIRREDREGYGDVISWSEKDQHYINYTKDIELWNDLAKLLEKLKAKVFGKYPPSFFRRNVLCTHWIKFPNVKSLSVKIYGWDILFSKLGITRRKLTWDIYKNKYFNVYMKKQIKRLRGGVMNRSYH